MAPPLLLLPFLTDESHANMATDLWMLRAFPRPDCPRLRHYGWNRPCHTFGYGQDFDWVAKQAGEPFESLCRRPTGGGLVDHRDDWTYSLVIPAVHPAAGCQIRASYEALHRALAEARSLLGVETKAVDPPSRKGGEGDFPSSPGHCFEEPVAYDLSRLEDGAKVAGAAMKRGREGLLLQGSIQRQLVPDLSWEQLIALFSQRLALFLETIVEAIDWPSGWEEAREPFLKEIESADWQRR